MKTAEIRQLSAQELAERLQAEEYHTSGKPCTD